MDRQKIKRLTAVSVFCALAYICVFVFRIKIGGFLTFDAKDAVMAIGAMVFGPMSALVMSLVVSVLEFLTVSDTGIFGLIMNFIGSFAFTGTASIIYKYRKSFSGAIAGLTAGSVMMTISMLLFNLIITPIYSGIAVRDVMGMIPTLLLPFNLSKAIFNSGLVLLLYKPVSNMLKKSKILDGGETVKKPGKREAVIFAVAAVLITASLVFMLVVMHGEFSLIKK